MKRTSILLAGLAIAAGLVFAGCGGDDETTTPVGASGATGVSGAPLSKSEFITQADAICKAGNKEIEAVAADVQGEPTGAELEQIVNETIVPEIQGEIDSISLLTPPEGDEEEIAAISAAVQDGVDTLDSDPAELTSTDVFAEANKLAQDYGLKVCGAN